MTPPDRTSAAEQPSRRRGTRTKAFVGLLTCCTVIAIAVAVVQPWETSATQPTQPMRYLGLHEPDAPGSYADVDEFAQAVGRQPNLVSYYSPWNKPFQAGFANQAVQHGALTLIQMDPTNVPLSTIVSGRYDPYLRAFATAVKLFGAKIVLSFGHEMNGDWYSWGNQHTSPEVFVAAWRHIVNVFRSVGADNVKWLWTVNVIDEDPPVHIPSPARWWPGNSYVDWVGIDGYYYLPPLPSLRYSDQLSLLYAHSPATRFSSPKQARPGLQVSPQRSTTCSTVSMLMDCSDSCGSMKMYRGAPGGLIVSRLSPCSAVTPNAFLRPLPTPASQQNSLSSSPPP